MPKGILAATAGGVLLGTFGFLCLMMMAFGEPVLAATMESVIFIGAIVCGAIAVRCAVKVAEHFEGND